MKLSVLMSIYKKENSIYFDKALKSIWDEQVLKPDEIILVKDGKLTNELEKIIKKWENKIPNILKVVGYEDNRGLGYALNYGLKYCNGEYIARMDTDDIALPQRFKKQIEFLKKNKNVDGIGSSAILIDLEDNKIGFKLVEENIDFNTLIKKCDIIHPSIMLRKSFFERYGNYNEYFKKSQDYDLWLRATKEGAILKNIKETLIKFRISKNLIKRRKEEQKYNIMIKKQYKKGLEYYISIIPNILIIVLPNFILQILLTIRTKNAK